jgi:hypothetical protein
MMRRSDFYPKTIFRRLDFTYPTNRLIIVLAIGTGILFGGWFMLIHHTHLWEAIEAGFIGGAGGFLAWALSRELDPDHDLSAFVSTGLVVVLLFGQVLAESLHTLDIWGLVVVLFLCRFLSRIKGLRGSITDSLVLLGVMVIAVSLGTPWVLGIMVAAGFGLDARLDAKQKPQIFFAGVALIIAILGLTQQSADSDSLSSPMLLLLGGFGLGFAWFIWHTRTFTSQPDKPNRYPLQPHRIRLTMSLALLGSIGTVLWGGVDVFYGWLPLWASLGGITLYALGLGRIQSTR